MRTLIVALGFAAIATGPALAATGIASGSASVSGAATGTATSGITTGTSSSGTTAGTTTTGTTTSGTLDTGTSGIQAGTPSGGTGTSNVPAGGANTAFGSNTTTDINADTPGSSFAPGGPFSNDSGNTALGTSPGQTSSGTFAGNSSNGINADSSSLNNGTAINNGVSVVPEGNVSVIGGGGTGARVVGVPNAVSPQGTGVGSSATPLFDQAAREGRAREARRRARGDEPRVYGIAPNTERDLTWQMPDDKIIRY